MTYAKAKPLNMPLIRYRSPAIRARRFGDFMCFSVLLRWMTVSASAPSRRARASAYPHMNLPRPASSALSRRVQMGGVVSRRTGGSGREPRHCLGAMVDAQLAVDVCDVPLHGGQADHQLIGNLLIPHASGNEPQDLHLAWRKRLRKANDDFAGRRAVELSVLVQGS